MLVDWSFSITDSGCGTETNEASVEFRQDALVVAVSGTITGRDGSMTSELENVEYDEERESLEVVIGTTERSGGMYPQCLMEIGYEAAFGFDGRLPRTVDVRHRSFGELRSVAKVSA